MKLVLFNDYRLGVLRDSRVLDAMDALEGFYIHRHQDRI